MIPLRQRWRALQALDEVPLTDGQAILAVPGPYPETRLGWVRLVEEFDPLGAEWLAWPIRFWLETFTAMFVAADEEGHLRAEVDPVAMAGFAMDVSHGAFAASLALTELADLEERLCHDWEVVFGCMATEEWLAGWRADGGMAAAMRRRFGSDPSDGGGVGSEGAGDLC